MKIMNSIDRIHDIVICGIGYQAETIATYMSRNSDNKVILLIDHFTQKPSDCYRIPSKRNLNRNSFSEVDMMMDATVGNVPVKRFDMLSIEEKESCMFAYYDDDDSINIFEGIREVIGDNYYYISRNEIAYINKCIWDRDKIIKSLWKTNQFLYSEIHILKNALRRQLPSTIYDFHFEFHLVEHCNLKCAGCTHFSSIAKEEYADLEEFQRDINRLSELTGGITRFINLLGGEPLLHPQICDFFDVARNAFPNTVIRVVTNGIKLSDMNQKFWGNCRKNKIVIGITKYPIDIDYDGIIKKINEEEITYECFSGDDLPRDEMWRLCLDETGNNRPLENFIKCPRANACIFVKHGKVFNCATMANINHFNTCFNTKLEISESDFADIYKCQSIDEILEILCSPKPFCRYCSIEGRKYGTSWERTKTESTEWGKENEQ